MFNSRKMQRWYCFTHKPTKSWLGKHPIRAQWPQQHVLPETCPALNLIKSDLGIPNPPVCSFRQFLTYCVTYAILYLYICQLALFPVLLYFFIFILPFYIYLPAYSMRLVALILFSNHMLTCSAFRKITLVWFLITQRQMRPASVGVKCETDVWCPYLCYHPSKAPFSEVVSIAHHISGFFVSGSHFGHYGVMK